MIFKNLPDVCKIQYGYAFDSAKFSDNEGMPLVRIRDVVRGYSETYTTEGCDNEYIVQNGDLLIGMDGEFNIARWNGGKAYLNQRVCRLIPTDKIDALYLFYFMPIALKAIEDKTPFVTVKHLSAREINKIVVPFPDINAQKEIADKIQKIDSIINARREQLAKLDELVKSRFIELMQAHPNSNLLSDFISSYKAERCGDRDIPVLSITKEDGIVFQNEKFKKRIASADASTYKVVPRGKLVQGIHIDERNFAIQNIADEGIVSPAYKIWNVDEEKAIPEVLAYAMRTDRTMAYMSSKFTGSVKRRESISTVDFMATPIDLPSIKVQTEFYAFMKQTDKSKMAIQESLDKLETLKKALMQEYFG